MPHPPRTRAVALVAAVSSLAVVAGACTDDADWAAAPLGEPVAASASSDAAAAPDWLFVLDAPSATLDSGADELTLTLQAPGHVLAFTDRPARDAEFVRPTWLATEWEELFGEDPPNAVLTGLSEDGSTVEVAVVVESLEGDGAELTASLTGLGEGVEGLPASLRQVALFVDDVVVPTDAQDWTFHSIIVPGDQERYVSRAALNPRVPDEDDIYSMPALDLIENYDPHTTVTAPAG